MTEPSPIATWLIELKGDGTNLRDWQLSFHDCAIAAVERLPGRDGEPAYFVRSQRLDGVLDTEAHASAERLVAQMSGAMALTGGPRARMSWLWYVRSGEKPEPLKEVVVSVGFAVERLAAIDTGEESGQFAARTEERALRAVAVAEHCDQIAAALEHFGAPPNWYDMWTAYEIIEEDLWKRTPKAERPKPDKGAKLRAKRILLMNREWVSDDDLRKFAESCNFHRPGRRRPLTPERNATTDEAQSILARLLQRWIEGLGASTGVNGRNPRLSFGI